MTQIRCCNGVAWAGLCFLAAACGSSARHSPKPQRPGAVTTSTQKPPRLVVSVVLDQLGSRVLERYLPYLPSDGILAKAAQRGAYHRRVVIGYAATLTGPGHAAIFTGAPPSLSGLMANSLWDRAHQRFVPSEDDRQHAVFGVEGEFASPKILRAESVGDVLKRQTGGAGKVVSISMKARAAVLSGGQRPDLAAWYDGAIPGFTTSTYYVDQAPPWMETWRQANPLSARLGAWNAGDPAMLQRVLGDDNRPGEGDWEGWGPSFPHPLGDLPNASETFIATPQGSEYLLDFALECVRQYHLGEDHIPDLLAISVSGTDYVGHVFGPDSWEYLDNLIRVDRALRRLVDALEARTTTAFLITSDHGVAPLPEHARAEGRPAGRVADQQLMAALNQSLEARFGAGKWVEAYGTPLLYLSAAAREPQRRDDLVAAAVAWLRTVPELAGAYDVREAAGWGSNADPARRAVGLSIHPSVAADIFLVPAPYYLVVGGSGVSSTAAGTSHGTPWSYDREVPVLFWGAGVKPSSTIKSLDHSRVATTLARLLGIAKPAQADEQALPGAP